MYIELLEKHSAYYWLKTLFVDAPFVNVEEGFPNNLLSLPTVSVEWETIDSRPFEIGNKTPLKEIKYSLDVFANDKNQRDEFIFRVFNGLDMGISVYNYDEGFPPSVSPSTLGCLIPIRKNARNLPVLPNLSKLLYYRASISVTMVYDKI